MKFKIQRGKGLPHSEEDIIIDYRDNIVICVSNAQSLGKKGTVYTVAEIDGDGLFECFTSSYYTNLFTAVNEFQSRIGKQS